MIDKKEYNIQYRLNNREKTKEYNKQYNILNKESINKKSKKYYQDNKESEKVRAKIYSKNNRVLINQRDRIKKKINPLYKLKHSIRRNLWNILKNNRSKTSQEVLGCSFEYFKVYIENKFEPWMNWNNHGLYNGKENYGFDIDHIIPLASAKSTEDLIKLSHYTNLQPLCSYINRCIKRDN